MPYVWCPMDLGSKGVYDNWRLLRSVGSVVNRAIQFSMCVTNTVGIDLSVGNALQNGMKEERCPNDLLVEIDSSQCHGHVHRKAW